MSTFKHNLVEIYFELHPAAGGAASPPTILLIHGLSCQIIHWPPAFIDALTAGGCQVIAFDNRDVGLSSKLDDANTPSLEAIKRGETVKAPYNLMDMAADAVALLDTLNIDKAHVLGLSMGGMIAQRFVLNNPERVLSLTSIMSTTGDPSLPGADPAAWSAFISLPPEGTAPEDSSVEERDRAIAHNQTAWNTVAGPNYVSTDCGLGQYAAEALQRGFDRSGFVRQILAIITGGNRREELANVRVPVLAIHGDCDPLVPIACGEDTALAVQNGTLLTLSGMGHDLPAERIPEITAAILTHINQAQS